MRILLFQCDFCAIDSSNSRCHGVDVISAKLMRLKRSASMPETQTFLQVNPVIKMIEGQCMNMLHPLNHLIQIPGRPFADPNNSLAALDF